MLFAHGPAAPALLSVVVSKRETTRKRNHRPNPNLIENIPN